MPSYISESPARTFKVELAKGLAPACSEASGRRAGRACGTLVDLPSAACPSAIPFAEFVARGLVQNRPTTNVSLVPPRPTSRSLLAE